MGTLDEKVAIISGSGRGIGQAIALKLAAEGARVVVNDLEDGPADETIKKIEDAGGTAVKCIGDVTQEDFPEKFVNTAVDEWGELDIIVNNAGYAWDSVIQKMTDEQWQAMLDIHTTAPVRILRAAADFIRPRAKEEKEKGVEHYRKVVNISSVAGLFGNPGQTAYSAGKAAIIGVTKTLSKEWGRYNVNVNCAAFGFIHTRMTAPIGSGEEVAKIGDKEIQMGIQPEFAKAMEQMIPMGRGGTVEEAAGTVYLLCLPESNYISGQVLLASGGLGL